MTAQATRFLFVGGPGRSGTSYVARQLGGHPDIGSFPDIELKLISEKGGLLDLRHSLVEQYSPNRASVAVQQFRRMAHALFVGQYGQPPLSKLLDEATWTSLIEEFTGRLSPHGHPPPMGRAAFNRHARVLMIGIAALSQTHGGDAALPPVFMEKTPHSILAADFISELLPGSHFLHVMRDPRAIAFSLRQMRWGPDDLGACCTWVANYCESFQACLARPDGAFPPLRQIYIEEVAQCPDGSAVELTDWLGIPRARNLFGGASTGVLNAWQASCSSADRNFLNLELARLAKAFGYEADDIGARNNPASSELVSASGQ